MFNFLAIAVAALVPLLMGFIWYHPKVFGTAWMNALGFNSESMKGVNMVKIFVLTYILSFFAAFSMQFIVIHQFAYYSLMANEPGANDPNSPIGQQIAAFMAIYGHHFKTFGHGALHGVLVSFFLITPIIAINGLFEKRNFKYIAINSGFWIVCVALMGGIVCQWAK
jgi:hypothetical protein